METIAFEIEVDIPALRRALAETAAAIAELKKSLRRTWTRPMAPEQRALWSLKDKATLLNIVRALLRGRHHLQRPPVRWTCYHGAKWEPAAYHRQAAERALELYGLGRPRATEAVQ